MKRALTITLAVLAASTFVAADLADAKRLGGGRSVGAQRQSVAPQQSAPPTAAPSNAASQPVMPATAGTAAAAKAAPATNASGASRWLGPIAGLATGLGLAALFSYLGLSEELASFLLIALLVLGVVFIVRLLFARRAAERSTMQYAGAGGLGTTRGGYENRAPRTGESRVEPVLGSILAPASAAKFPPGFDARRFAIEAKRQFHALQAAYDNADRAMLRDVVTPQMYAEIERDLEGRGTHRATEVVSLDAEVFQATTEGDAHWASVRFTGQTREDGVPNAQPFDEVWHLTKPVDDSSGWQLAGIQQASATPS